MDSNTHSIAWLDRLAALEAQVDRLAAQPPDGLADAALAEGWCGWGGWRTAWTPGPAHSLVRTARALYRGPLTGTGQALAEGEVSLAHAQVLAHRTHDLADQVAVEAEPVLLEAARRLDPARLRQAMAHLRLVADPDGAQDRAEHHQQRRGLWVASTIDGMVAVDGLLEPEAGQSLLAALEPLARPASAADPRSAGQRRADGLAELARRHLEGGRLPQSGGVRPQLLVTVDLDTLLGHPGGVGGEAGGVGPLDPEACRRLACDGAVTRVVVTRHPTPPPAPTSATPTGRLATPAGWTGSEPTTTPGPIPAWRPGCGWRRPGCPRPWVGPRPSRWRWAGPAGWCPPPTAPPSWSATAAAGSRPGARPSIWSPGWMAAPPTWPTWCWCAGPTIGRSMRAAGGWAATPTGGWPPSHRIEDPVPRPDPATRTNQPPPPTRRPRQPQPDPAGRATHEPLPGRPLQPPLSAATDGRRYLAGAPGPAGC
jgi:Domain of unknown function (DUF222)